MIPLAIEMLKQGNLVPAGTRKSILFLGARLDYLPDTCDLAICKLVEESYSLIGKPVDQRGQEEMWLRGLAGAAFVRYSFRTHNQHPLAVQYYRLEGTERQQLFDHAVRGAKADASMESILAIQLMVEFASGCFDVDYLKHREFLKGMATSTSIS